MPRIESSDQPSLPIDLTPEPAPSPVAPDASRGKPATRNEVVIATQDGPARHAATVPTGASGAGPRSAATPSPSGASRQNGLTPMGGGATSGPTVSAGELAALGGRLRPASSEAPTAAYADIRSHLSTSWDHWRVDPGDVKAAHAALGTLEPKLYRATLERMEGDGLLRTYVQRQDPDSRHAFLEQAESKGVLRRLPGEATSGPLGCPGRPDFFRNDTTLPESMRDAVNGHNIQRGREHFRDYAAYLQRYRDAVGRANSLAELRALGEPRENTVSSASLGLGAKDPSRRAYEAAFTDSVHGLSRSRNAAYVAVSARERELEGKRPAGSVMLKGEVEGTYGSFKTGGEALVGSRGVAELKGKTGVAVKGTPIAVEVKQDTRGEMEAELKLDLKVLEFTKHSDGELEFSIGASRRARAYVTLNPRESEMGFGVSAEVEKEGNGVEAKAGLVMQGLSPERARRAVDPRSAGLFERPPELVAGTAWDALPEHRRAEHERNHWTRETWTRALGR